MRIINAAYLLMLGTLVSGCVSSNIDYTVSLDENYGNEKFFISSLERHHNAYAKCIFEHSYIQLAILEKSINKSRTVEICNKEKENYYKSVYFSSFKGRNNVNKEFRHNTARDALMNTTNRGFAAAKESAK